MAIICPLVEIGLTVWPKTVRAPNGSILRRLNKCDFIRTLNPLCNL